MAESQETSDYPGSLDTWNTVTDKEDLVEQSDINKIKAALLAIQTELGADVAGSVTNLVTRLAVSLANSGALAQGTSDPGSAVIGQPLYRTDTDQFKIYDGSTWDTIGPGGFTLKSVTSLSAVDNTGDITLEPNKLYEVIFSLTQNTTANTLTLRFNSDSGGNYDYSSYYADMDSTAPASGNIGGNSSTGIPITPNTHTAAYKMFGKFTIDTTKVNADSAFLIGQVIQRGSGTGFYEKCEIGGVYLADTTITDFELFVSAGTFTGNVYLYEYALST